MRKIILVALLALGGCAANDTSTQNALKAAQTAVQIAQGVYTSAPALLATYEALKPCGEPGAGKLCYDANVDQIAKGTLVALKGAIDTANAAIQNIGQSGVDVASVTATLITATGNVTVALAAFGVTR